MELRLIPEELEGLVVTPLTQADQPMVETVAPPEAEATAAPAEPVMQLEALGRMLGHIAAQETRTSALAELAVAEEDGTEAEAVEAAVRQAHMEEMDLVGLVATEAALSLSSVAVKLP